MMGGFLSKNSYWQMILAAFIFSLYDIFIKSLSPSFPSTGIAFFRFLTGGLILWRIILWREGSLRGNNIWMLLLRGITGTLSFFCLLKAISMIPLPNAIVLLYTFPLFVIPFSFLFLRESVGRRELVLIVIGFMGIYVLINPSSHAFNMGYIFGLLSGCIGALSMVSVRKLRQTDGPLIIYFYFCVVGGIMSFPFFAKEFKMPSLQQFCFLISASLLLLIGQSLMNYAFKYCKASEGSVILMAETVFAGIGGVLLFEDPVTPHFLAGGAMIVGSGVGLNLMNLRVRHSQKPSKA